MDPDDETDRSAESTPLGLRLFLLYLLLYGGYMGATVLAPRAMASTLAGVNVAILYGLLLIAVALLLALVYVTLLRRGRGSR